MKVREKVAIVTGAGSGFGRATAARDGGVDVLVNNAGIAQGTVRRTWDCDEDLWDRVLRVNLMRRAGSVLDIADAILYLACDDSAYVTGQEMVADGGYLVR